MACQCYAHLPCLGGVLDRGAGAGRAEGWTNQIHCLLASANSHLALIYQGAEMGTPEVFRRIVFFNHKEPEFGGRCLLLVTALPRLHEILT